jgi:uncharacterized protein (DUF58 family)
VASATRRGLLARLGLASGSGQDSARDTDAEAPLLDDETLRTLERLSLVSLDAIVTGFTGQRAGAAGAAGLEFADYRPYAIGDDLRRIDWNVYARLRELLVKVAPEEGHIAIDLLIDASRSMDYGNPNKLRHARRIAAALGTVALLRADAVRAWVLSDGGAEAGAGLDAPRMLIPLAAEVERLPSGRGTDLPASLRAYRRAAPLADLAMLIGDAMVPPASLAEGLEELASAARSIAFVHVIDRSEAAPSPRGALELRDRETGERLELTLSDSLSTSYEEHFEHFSAAVAEACAHAGARYVRAPTDVPAVEVLAESARVAGLVRL